MAGITREEFHQFYENTLFRKLKRLDEYRIKNVKLTSKQEKKLVLTYVKAWVLLILFTPVILGILRLVFKLSEEASSCIMPCFIFISFLPLLIYGLLNMHKVRSQREFRKLLKYEIVKPIINLYNLSFVSKARTSLTPEAINKLAVLQTPVDNVQVSDAFCGNYSGVELEIVEGVYTCKGRNSKKVPVYSGVVIKLSMNKNFTGKTIVCKKSITNFREFFNAEKIELEDLDFMQSYDVYSTDQVEARYLLTTAFMERVNKFISIFSDSSSFISKKTVQAGQSYEHDENYAEVGDYDYVPMWDSLNICFEKGFVYLFVPAKINFFEISFDDSLLDEEKYWLICQQVNSILEIVEYFKLDKNLGL